MVPDDYSSGSTIITYDETVGGIVTSYREGTTTYTEGEIKAWNVVTYNNYWAAMIMARGDNKVYFNFFNPDDK